MTYNLVDKEVGISLIGRCETETLQNASKKVRTSRLSFSALSFSIFPLAAFSSTTGLVERQSMEPQTLEAITLSTTAVFPP